MIEAVLDLIFPPRPTERALRTLLPEAFLGFLDPRTTDSGITALLPYDEPLVRAAVTETKLHGSERAACLLGTALTAYLKEELQDLALYEERACVLVPLPLSCARRRQRGYNQVEMVAKRAAKRLMLPLDTTLLTRTRDTEPQTALDGARRRTNMQGAFALLRPPDPHTFYTILDDVVTTGATMAEALAVLRRAGAESKGIVFSYSVGNG